MSDEPREPENLPAVSGRGGSLTTFTLTPRNFDEAFRMAEIMVKSSLVPKEYRGKTEDVLVAMQLGFEVGLAPMQALQSIYVANGKPQVFGDAPLALVRGSGLLEWIKEEDDGETATCTAKRRGDPNPIRKSFSAADSKRIKVTIWENGNRRSVPLSDKETWQNYPERMRQMRARAFVLRDGFGDVLKGLRIKEEVDDYIDAEVVDQPINAKAEAAREANMMPSRKSESPTPPAAEAKTEKPAPVAETTKPIEPEIVEPEKPKPEGTVAPGGKTTFKLYGSDYSTQGLTKEQLRDSFKLEAMLDAREGKGATEAVLKAFGFDNRCNLDEETGGEFLAALSAKLG